MTVSIDVSGQTWATILAFVAMERDQAMSALRKRGLSIQETENMRGILDCLDKLENLPERSKGWVPPTIPV